MTPGALSSSALPEGVQPLLAPHLGRQRWYAGSAEPPAERVTALDVRRLWSSGAGHRLWWSLVEAEGARYQVLIGERPAGEPADFLSGREEAVLGVAGASYFYDATIDPELALALLEVVSDGVERAERVRPVSTEQSNTSLVYDDRVILKVFRRLGDGTNPDVEVTTALAAAGFDHVAAPVASWSVGGVDLAFAQEFLAGGSEGWALALTSLRDYYSAEGDDPAEAGGDFAAEAARLGSVTATMHLALARAFGVDREESVRWSALIDDVERRLRRVVKELGNDLPAPVDRLVEGLRSVADPGPVGRVHGDYHLGQVMETDGGWYVLDFEGEPARPVESRVVPASPLKDVTGMLRSFHYASRFALRDRGVEEAATLAARARAWEDHNRAAFLGGYLATDGIADLLPPSPPPPAAEPEDNAPLPPVTGDAAIVAAAYELDKALYELDYERAYRPDWVDIPMEAVRRVLAGLED